MLLELASTRYPFPPSFLGIFGILKAGEENPCAFGSINDTNCVAQTPAFRPVPVEDANDSSLFEMPVVIDYNPNEFELWLAGATGCGVLFAFLCTLALWLLEDATRKIKE